MCRNLKPNYLPSEYNCANKIGVLVEQYDIKKGIYRRLRLGWHSLKKERKKYHKQNCNIKNLTLKFILSMEKICSSGIWTWDLLDAKLTCKPLLHGDLHRNIYNKIVISKILHWSLYSQWKNLLSWDLNPGPIECKINLLTTTLWWLC